MGGINSLGFGLFHQSEVITSFLSNNEHSFATRYEADGQSEELPCRSEGARLGNASRREGEWQMCVEERVGYSLLKDLLSYFEPILERIAKRESLRISIGYFSIPKNFSLPSTRIGNL